MMTFRFIIYLLIAVYAPLLAVPSEAGYQATFTPRISVNTDYTDNIFSSKEERQADYITVISPGFTAQLLERTRGMKLSYDLGYSCYDKFVELNTLRHNSGLTGWIEFSRHTRLDFKNQFLLTEESVTELQETPEEAEDRISEAEKYIPTREDHIAETETVRKTRRYHYTNSASIGVTHRFGKYDLLTVKYLYSILGNEDPYVEDETSHEPSAGLTWWLIPDELELEAGLACAREESSGTPDDPYGYWEESINPSFGLAYWFIPKEFSVETGISYKKGEFSDTLYGPAKWYESINPSAGLEYHLKPYKLDIKTDVSYTIGQFSEPSDDFDNLHGSIQLTKKFTKHLEGNVRYDHSIMDFKDRDKEDYKVHEPSVGITYVVAEGVPLSFQLGYIMRDRQRSQDDAFISLDGDLGKTWNFSRYGSVNLETASGYDESYFGTEKLGFGVYYDAKCTLKYAFSKYLSANVYGSYRMDKYTDLDTKRDDQTTEVGSGLIYNKKWLSLKLDYLYRAINSTSDENDYEESRIRMKVMLAPSRPVRLFQ
ncbi:outer membrane beta-barrel protein [Desulfococcaceae bacterium HSG8]|nr:outer membrane beta-barrel protein [Desulfococcaceae bacterium HSG8]